VCYFSKLFLSILINAIILCSSASAKTIDADTYLALEPGKEHSSLDKDAPDDIVFEQEQSNRESDSSNESYHQDETADGKQAPDLSHLSQPTLEEVIEKALTAYGGIVGLSQIAKNSVSIGEVVTRKSENKSLAYRHVRKAEDWRTDMEQTDSADGSSVIVTAFDGTNYWQMKGQSVEYLEESKAKWFRDLESRDPCLLARWKIPNYRFRLLGEASYKNLPVFAVEVKEGSESPTMVLLDRTNYLVVAISYSSIIPETCQLARVTKEYSENRPTCNTLWPFEQTEFVNGEKTEQIKLSTCLLADAFTFDFFNSPRAQGAQQAHLPNPVTIPFDYSQREIILRGRIEDGEPLEFLFDTGASETIIDRHVAAQSLLSKGGQFQISSLGGDVSTQRTKIGRLELGNLILNDVEARLLDLSPQSRQLGKSLGGIIGMNVISKYLVTIDYSKPSLVFSDTAAGARPPHAVSVPFVQSTVPVIKVTLPGRDSVQLLMDTGAAFNHLSTSVASRHLNKDALSSGHIVEGTGLDGRSIELGTMVIDPVTIGSDQVRKVLFTYPISHGSSDVTRSGVSIKSPFQSIGNGQINGILGNPFWENFVVTIDGLFQRLLLKLNPVFTLNNQFDKTIAAGDTALSTKRDFRVAEIGYQRALLLANDAHNLRYQALAQERLGNLRRVMAHDLKRPEHARDSYNYFSHAEELARKGDFKDVQGRILADWSLLYSDNGQLTLAKQTMDKAILLAPQDPDVNVDCAVHLFRNRMYGEAQKYIEKALFLEPENWQALWYQVKLSEMFGDLKKEKEILTEILKYYPWSKVAAEKLRAVDPKPSSDLIPIKTAQ